MMIADFERVVKGFHSGFCMFRNTRYSSFASEVLSLFSCRVSSGGPMVFTNQTGI